MKSAIVREPGGPDVITIEDLPEPEPREGEVAVRVAYAALNPLDTHARANRIPWMHPGFPFTPGFEYAGLVEALGAGVDESLLGRRVAVNAQWGGNAEKAIAPASALNFVPDAFNWKTAACYSTCAYSAWLLIHSAGRVEPGQTVVVHSAAGALGAMTLQIARSAGAKTIGLAGGNDKVAFALDHGADHGIDYTDRSWPEQVKSLTNGQGADLIIDGNAGADAMLNLDAIAPLGQLVFIGAMAGPSPDFPVSRLIGQSCSVTGFVKYAHEAVSGGREQEETHARIASGEWRIPLGRTLPLDDLAEAHRAFEARELTGRTLIEVGGEI